MTGDANCDCNYDRCRAPVRTCAMCRFQGCGNTGVYLDGKWFCEEQCKQMWLDKKWKKVSD